MIYNAIQCSKCGAIVTSKYRHDYNTCNCSNGSSINGGSDYVRVGGADLTLVTPGDYNEATKTFTPWTKEPKNEN